MKLIIGAKSDLHWGIDGEYLKIFKPVYLSRKEKIKEEFRIDTINNIEIYWISTQMTGTVSGEQAHVAMFRVVTDTESYEFPCNTGNDRENLLEAIEYFQNLGIQIKDLDNLIAGFKNLNVKMWDYIQNIIQERKR